MFAACIGRTIVGKIDFKVMRVNGHLKIIKIK